MTLPKSHIMALLYSINTMDLKPAGQRGTGFSKDLREQKRLVPGHQRLTGSPYYSHLYLSVAGPHGKFCSTQTSVNWKISGRSQGERERDMIYIFSVV